MSPLPCAQIRKGARLAALGAAAAMTCSCARLPTEPASAQAGPPSEQGGWAWRVAQIPLDGRSVYALCAPAQCPTPTVKTLAPVVAAATPASPATPATPASPGQTSGPDPDAPQEVLAEQRSHEGDLQDRLSPDRDGQRGAPSRTGLAGLATAGPGVWVVFASGSALLSRAARRTLDLALPKARAAGRIVIRGRTDAQGNATDNARLALARARAVRGYLGPRLGSTRAASLIVDARGGCCFVASNASQQGRQRNRRVELVFEETERASS